MHLRKARFRETWHRLWGGEGQPLLDGDDVPPFIYSTKEHRKFIFIWRGLIG
jgi:hypothetical protein